MSLCVSLFLAPNTRQNSHQHNFLSSLSLEIIRCKEKHQLSQIRVLWDGNFRNHQKFDGETINKRSHHSYFWPQKDLFHGVGYDFSRTKIKLSDVYFYSYLKIKLYSNKITTRPLLCVCVCVCICWFIIKSWQSREISKKTMFLTSN